MSKFRAALRWLGEDEKGQVVLFFLVSYSIATVGYICGYRDGCRD